MKIFYKRFSRLGLFLLATCLASGYSFGQTYNPDHLFGLCGFNGEVHCSAKYGSDLYIGGNFKTAGSLKANSIVRWDGVRWDSLAAGVVGTVRTMVVKGNDLYVGGTFSITSLPGVYCMAKWNILTKTWSAIGTKKAISGNFNAGMHSFAVDGDFIYMGGRFNTIGDIFNLGSIIKYNTTNNTWINIGNFVNVAAPKGSEATVNHIVIHGGKVYMAGDFTNAGTSGNTNVNTVVEWTGTNFVSLGNSNLFGESKSICFKGNEMYVSGNLGYSGYKNVVMLNPSNQWISLTNQYPVDMGVVNTLEVYKNELYAGGNIGGQNTGSAVIKWDGTKWLTVNKGIKEKVLNNASDYHVNSLISSADGQSLFAFGYFGSADNIRTNNAARWDGTRWRMLGHTINGIVSLIKQKGSDIYVGGNFLLAGSDTMNSIARWDGAKWNKLGKGITSTGGITSIDFKGDTIYVAGNFTKAGDTAASGIAYYANSDWHSMGTGAIETNDIIVFGNKVFVAGAGLQSWDGKKWEYLGRNVGTTNLGANKLNDLEVGPDGKLYASGEFRDAKQNILQGVAAFDGKNFTLLKTGILPGYVAHRLKTFGKNLFAAGSFLDMAGVANTQNLAYWDGTNWNSAGNIQGGILGLETDGINLYASGNLTTVNGVLERGIAVYNGTLWKLAIKGENLGDNSYSGQLQYAMAVTCDAIWVPGISMIKVNKTGCVGILQLTSPTGAESWPKTNQRFISWNQAGVNTIKIEYSSNGGTNWNLIAANIPSTQKGIEWTLPDLISANMKVKITSEQNAAITDMSGIFSTNNQSSILIKTQWTQSTPITTCTVGIRWSSYNVSNVRIDYSDKPGTWVQTVTVPAASGFHEWKVPAGTSRGIRVKVTDASNSSVSDSTYTGFTNNAFECPKLVVSNPSNSNISYKVGSIQTLSFQASNTTVNNVKVELSTDNGQTWSVLNANLAMSFNFASMNWTVPNQPSSKCLIKVSDVANPSLFGVNNSVFDITLPPSLTIQSPNGGEILTAGMQQTITWDYTGTLDDIYVMLMYGGNLIALNNLPANAKTLSFIVPGKLSNKCKIFILESTSFAILDSSNADFTIEGGAEPAATITSPIANATIAANSNIVITWTSANLSIVSLEYSTNSGALWNSIVDVIPANNARGAAQIKGQYKWAVPNIPNGQSLMLRIGSGVAVFDQIFYSVGSVNSIEFLQENSVEKLTLYPNPATDFIHFSGVESGAIIEIFNSMGITMTGTSTIANPSSINISQLAEGIYFIKAQSTNKKYTGSFMKK